MCGIVGYTGADAAKGILVDGLKRLEYRGYDSSGVALEVSEGGTTRLDVTRRVGKVAGLESELANLDDASTCGIGHTRWATHGRPSVANAHPHVSCDGRIAVVHNGIVENFQELREELEGRGHTFRSETDTEVFAHLIEDAYAASRDLMAAVRDACSHVVGAYGLAVVCADEPGVIAVARKDSPIVIGMGERGAYVASDVIALIGASRMASMPGSRLPASPTRTRMARPSSRTSPTSTGTSTWPKRAATRTSCSRRFTSSLAWCATRSWAA